jgi:hypothetical protein
MRFTEITRRGGIVATACSLLLLADLFLPWQKASVDVVGVVQAEANNPGWKGWGGVAGVLALVLLALLGRRRRQGGEVKTRHELLECLLGVGVFGAAALAVFTGDAHVFTTTVGVEADTTLWPAWLGLLLAAGVGFGAAAPLVSGLAAPTGPRVSSGA